MRPLKSPKINLVCSPRTMSKDSKKFICDIVDSKKSKAIEQ